MGNILDAFRPSMILSPLAQTREQLIDGIWKRIGNFETKDQTAKWVNFYNYQRPHPAHKGKPQIMSISL